jgi:peptidoglycan hydrolase-like protein with peptidoglycan-binding domain
MDQAYATGPDLYPWDVGEAVAELQELLCAYGFTLKVDSDFGWRTEVAVKTYQSQHGLRIDGVVGPETWRSLKSGVKACTRELKRDRSGADVLELQKLLHICGYPVLLDGKFGPETEQAVIAFQQNHHLKPDGIVNAVTWRLLKNKRLPESPPQQRSWIDTSKWW